jgi:phage tail-like protein
MMNSEYLQYLPRVFKEGTGTEADFLGQYLKIFEALLSAREDARIKDQEDNDVKVTGLEELISIFENHLDAALTPVEQVTFTSGRQVLDSRFLTYLARWVALVFDQNWELDQKRAWLQKIVPLYKKRGTKSGLVEYLNTFVGRQVQVEEPPGGFVIAENSTVGIDTFIAGAPAYYFRVKINYGFPPDEIFEIDVWKNVRKGIQVIVDLEKPAHTYYNLDARTPGIIVGGPIYTREKARSTVGVDTLIWEKSKKI